MREKISIIALDGRRSGENKTEKNKKTNAKQKEN